MSNPVYRVAAFAADFDLESFDCGETAWNLGKLAVHVDLRADKDAQWGRQLLREALQTIVRVADVGGGEVIVVDADNPGLLDFYTRNGFKATGNDGDLSLYMKVSTARRAFNSSARSSCALARMPTPRAATAEASPSAWMPAHEVTPAATWTG